MRNGFRQLLAGALIGLAIAAAETRAIAAPPDPAAFVGHEIGEDHKLVKWPKIVEYFELLAKDSPRVDLVDIGKTTLGNRMIAAIVSSPENLKNAAKYREIARRLADPRTLKEGEALALAEQGRAIVVLTLNIHSTEIASSQMALKFGHYVATDQSSATKQALDETILLIVPSLNPDGQIMVCDWYDKHRGTPFEGGRLPFLYHHYAGHDNNRDWFMLNLVETRLVTKFLYHEWHPQVLFDQHQQGNTGARMFLPPYYDPINPNVHPLMWRQIELFGAELMTRLESEGKSGVVSNSTYDGWRPGDMDTTPWWHNVVALISEAASVRVASPIFQRADELTGNGRGLETHRAQMNYPNPWPGGWWRLRDIVDYELSLAIGYWEAAARRRVQLLTNSYRMNRDAIEKGKKEGPFAFVVPVEGNDPYTVRVLAETLMLAGVEIHRAKEPFTADAVGYGAGSLVVSMQQPLRPYAKDLLEAQAYPNRELYPGGPPERPYDEAGWTLPMKMGLRVTAVTKAFDTPLEMLKAAELPKGRVVNGSGAATAAAAPAAAFAFAADSNAATIAVSRLLKAGAQVTWASEPIVLGAGQAPLPRHSFSVAPSATVDAAAIAREIEGLGLTAYGVSVSPDGPRMKAPRVALYQQWGGNMDEGWTRLMFEKFEAPFVTVHNDVIKAGELEQKFDVIVLPSATATQIVTGENSPRARTPTLPPPYAGGIGDDGVANLIRFVRAGGTVVAMDGAANFAIERFDLPVRNVLAGKRSEEFFCPGSLLEVDVDNAHYVTAGLRDTAHVFFNGSPAFEIVPRFGEAAPVALAAYGLSNPLRSGWLRGEALLRDRAALVEAPLGKGRVLLIGFRAQFRAQTYGTFRVLLNSLYYAALPRPSTAPAAQPSGQ